MNLSTRDSNLNAYENSQQLYARALPRALAWIEKTLEVHASETRMVQSFGFRRLPLYFPSSLLYATKVVVIDEPPVPPLSEWGLSELAPVVQHAEGVTLDDTYFLTAGGAASESLHFHELIHAIQWRVLGRRDFLLLYAAGLADHGYADSPLELMAYNHQQRFDLAGPPYSVHAEVGAETLSLLPPISESVPNSSEIFDSDSGQAIAVGDICRGVGPGWGPLLKELLFRMLAAGWDGRVCEVKEKMGCLCVYIDQDRADLWDMTFTAGERSAFICELCGSVPPRNADGSATTWRCEVCHRRRNG